MSDNINHPELITRQSLANEAANRWAEQYSPPHWLSDPEKQAIKKNLLALGANPAPDSVDKIIGNVYWTKPHDCSGCNKNFNAIVRVGQDRDYESYTAYLCEACLRAALALIVHGEKS